MSNLKENLSENNQRLLQIQGKISKLINNKPSGGVELPELINEGSASDLLLGKEFIDGDGNIVEGTIPTFDGSYECSGESTGGGSSVETCTVIIEYNVVVARASIDSSIYCSTLDNNGKIQSITLQSGVDFVFSEDFWIHTASITINNIVKNSILIIVDVFDDIYNENIQHDFELISEAGATSPRIFFIRQDGTITIS